MVLGYHHFRKAPKMRDFPFPQGSLGIPAIKLRGVAHCRQQLTGQVIGDHAGDLCDAHGTDICAPSP